MSEWPTMTPRLWSLPVRAELEHHGPERLQCDVQKPKDTLDHALQLTLPEQGPFQLQPVAVSCALPMFVSPTATHSS